MSPFFNDYTKKIPTAGLKNDCIIPTCKNEY